MTNNIKNDNGQFRLKYAIQIDRYKRLGHNLKEALESFLQQKSVPFVSVDYRLKSYVSFVNKVKKKKYKDPFNEIEDLCGLRIICYFQSDIQKIKQIINNEFQVIDSFDKEKTLNPTEFGYRSSHFIVKIKSEWLHAPNYRGTEDLKAEIQVRTILMHSWAEIEHKLAYKKHQHIPPQFRRKFSRISAKLEEADEQFEELSQLINEHKGSLINEARIKKHFDKNADMNLDSLQAFLDYHFPDGKKSIGKTRELVDEFLRLRVSIKDLEESYEKVRDYLPDMKDKVDDLKQEIEQSNLLQGMLEKSKHANKQDLKIHIQKLTKTEKN